MYYICIIYVLYMYYIRIIYVLYTHYICIIYVLYMGQGSGRRGHPRPPSMLWGARASWSPPPAMLCPPSPLPMLWVGFRRVGRHHRHHHQHDHPHTPPANEHHTLSTPERFWQNGFLSKTNHEHICLYVLQ